MKGTILIKSSECVLCTFNLQEIQVCEYSDLGQLPVTESILLQLGLEELIVVASSDLFALIQSFCPNTNVRSVNPSPLDESLLTSDLERIVMKDQQEVFLSELGKKCMQTLLSSFRILSIGTNFGACKIFKANFDSIYMQLDRACFNALNLFGDASLFSILNKSRTRAGARRLEQWIKQPLVDAEKIAERHEIVGVLVENGRMRQTIQSQRLTRVCDLDGMRTKLGIESTSLEDLVRIFESVIASQHLASDLIALNNSVINRVLGEPLKRNANLLEGFMKLVETTIDLSSFRVAAKFDPELEILASKRSMIETEIERLRSGVARVNRLENLRVVDTIAPYGKGFRVVRKQMVAAQKVSKSKQVQLNKAEYIFTTPELIDLVEELNSIEETYSKKSSEIVKKIVSVASSYAGVVGELADLIGAVDVLNSFAIAASTWRLTRPEPGSKVDLKNCRHLLVEIRAAVMNGHDYIPNNVEMSRNKNEGCVQIVTGPNMGGKSTYIRSVGLAVLMNQIGSFVPCDAGSSLPLFGAIMCRIGASDAQVRGVSTFMQEMIEASVIVNAARETSLVIIDELGRGTSTQDGFGLAWAICEYLKNEAKSFVLFATHFHQLAALPGAMNRHVAATVDEKGLTLLYEVRDGSTSESFGTNVAVLAGYPEKVVEDAILREREQQQLIY